MPREHRDIRDDEYVSHYGSKVTGKPEFLDRPRPIDNGALSVIVGKLTAAQAHGLVRSRDSVPTEADGVRHALVRDLREKGFIVTHDPTRRNPDHTTIRYTEEWGNHVAGVFTGCFGKPQWHGEDPEGGAK